MEAEQILLWLHVYNTILQRFQNYVLHLILVYGTAILLHTICIYQAFSCKFKI